MLINLSNTFVVIRMAGFSFCAKAIMVMNVISKVLKWRYNQFWRHVWCLIPECIEEESNTVNEKTTKWKMEQQTKQRKRISWLLNLWYSSQNFWTSSLLFTVDRPYYVFLLFKLPSLAVLSCFPATIYRQRSAMLQ